MIKWKLYLFILLTSLFFFGCLFESSNSTLAGGDVTGTGTARVKGLVLDSNQKPLSGGIIHLRPQHFLAPLPGESKSTTFNGADGKTDHFGKIDLKNLEPGKYRLEVIDSSSQNGSGFAILVELVLIADSSANLGSLILKPVAHLKGHVDSVGNQNLQKYVQIEGLERLAVVDNQGNYFLQNLPEGIVNLQIAEKTSNPLAPGASLLIFKGVKLTSNQSTTVQTLVGWKYSNRLTLNTTKNGANVNESVYNFPVLVRLDSNNFNFNEAKDSGQDIRFTKENGLLLPFEIESWDSLHKQAAVWVKVDTLLGNNSSQFIILNWEASSIQSTTQTPVTQAVFDTTNGFAAVWHMNSIQTSQLNSSILFPDATPHHNDGHGNLSTPGSKGIIASAQIFNGTTDFINCGQGTSLSLTSALTVSAWVLVTDTIFKHYDRILSKKPTPFSPNGYDFECSPKFEVGALGMDGEFALIGADSTLSRAFFPWQRSWHYCVITLRGTVTRFFLDGVEMTEINHTLTPLQTSTVPLLIGAAPWGDYFTGTLDEIRIMNATQSPASIQLNYANQKQNQSLVEFK